MQDHQFILQGFQLASTQALQNGIAVSGLPGLQGESKFFHFDIPRSTNSVNIEIIGGTGDSDLYASFRNDPNLVAYDCRPYHDNNDELCQFYTRDDDEGRSYIMLNSYSDYSNVSLLATYN